MRKEFTVLAIILLKCKMMQEILDILKIYNVVFVSNVADHLKCKICRKLIIDSFKGPCGCKICPSCFQSKSFTKTDTCLSSPYTYHFVTDQSTIEEITHLIVLCPHQNCDYQCELCELPHHLHQCFLFFLDRLTSNIDNETAATSAENIKEYIELFNVPHAQILRSFTENLENDMKYYLKKFGEKMNQSMFETDELRVIIDNIRREVESIKQNQKSPVTFVQHLVEDESVNEEDKQQQSLINEGIFLPEETKKSWSKPFNTCLLKVNQERIQCITSISLKMIEINLSRMLEREQVWKALIKRSVKQWKVLRANCGKLTDTFKNQLEEMRRTLKRLEHEQAADADSTCTIAQGIPRETDFYWAVQHVEEKCRHGYDEYSGSFYSLGASVGYKLCLFYCIYPSGGLWLTFRIMCGENDNQLQWPMKETIQIDIIDQFTALPVLSQTVSLSNIDDRQWPNHRKRAYGQPTNYRNDFGDGFIQFKSYEELCDITGVIRNDIMVIRCRVLPQS